MNVSIAKMTETDHEKMQKLLKLEDTGEELLRALDNKESNLYSIMDNNKIVGVSQVEEGEKAFLYLFIDPAFRRKGIGSTAVKLCEQKINNAYVKQIMTTYKISDDASKAFANKHGYIRGFSSTCMKYTGGQFDIPELPVRDYCDADYTSAHAMYARAFHEMRVHAGDFPDSVIEQPNDKMRKYWEKTSTERLVYVQNNEIIGYAHIEGNEIGSISVKSQNQRQGIGRNFMKYICNKILAGGKDSVLLFCVVGNNAKNLYDSLGFKELYTSDYAIKSIYHSTP
jgi:ribosomal protein S18 acetylase RimI-like enzyme